ncbi:MAG: 4Fe-4S binding protein, partial [Desulfobacterales bacterium]|nr:4Fe-4S binding protein [Desulfobacterales bacterium]
MDIQRLEIYIFSPTGTTQRITRAIADGIAPREIIEHDLTQAASRTHITQPSEADLVILAAPVYYGRLPESAVPLFRQLTGAGKAVVPVVVYGNREYDDALIELRDICVEQGFMPVAAGAFIGEHSYSGPNRPMAEGRPDAADLAKAAAFGIRIRETLDAVEGPVAFPPLHLPGNRPYLVPERLIMLKKIKETIPFTPETDTEICTQCGICTDACPEDAIDSCDVTDIDRWKCILCFACVKSCPEQAKVFTEPNFNAAVDQMALA